MGLSVTFVSGPRRCGKSDLITTMVRGARKVAPHYLRLVRSRQIAAEDGARHHELDGSKLASSRRLVYEPERIFEILPEALAAIHKKDRFGCVVIEADAEASLRCAYPYDHRVFVMPTPSCVVEVFRDPARAAQELQRCLDDTAAFAEEIFGLFDDVGPGDPDPSEDRSELSDTQMRGFLYSPLGDELATRIQLQTPYHGLVESDVVVVNTSVGQAGLETKECLRRLDHLLKRTGGVAGRTNQLFLCDPASPDRKGCKKLLNAIKSMCEGGT